MTNLVTWGKVCKHHKIPRTDWLYNGQDNYIEFVDGKARGSRIELLDLSYKPSDELYERYGSAEYTGGWIEEAGEVHFGAFDVLKTRIGRHMNDECNPKMLITCNPKKNWLYQMIYKPFKEGTLGTEYAFIQSLYQDNPHTAETYGQQLADIKDKAQKQRLMYGNWEYDDDPNTLINYESLIDLFTNAVDSGSRERFITADIARYGQDKTMVMVWEGWTVKAIYVWEKQGLDVTTQKIKKIIHDHRVPFSHVIIDEDGVGGGVVDNLQGVKGFVNNAAPIGKPKNIKAYKLFTEEKDKPNYQNLKTQCYYMMADNVNERAVAIDWEDIEFNSETGITSETWRQEFIEEMEQVKSADVDKDNKLRLLSKEDVKELLGRSPDSSDTFIMRQYFELKHMKADDPGMQERRERVARTRKKSYGFR